MRLIFMGTPDYVIPVLQALTTNQDFLVVGVYTPPDRPRGRGRATEMPPVKSFALECGLPVYQPPSLRPSPAQEELAGLRPDVIVVAAYGKLLPLQVLQIPTHGCLNLHPSLVPRYRGPSPVAAAILDGEVVTGTTLMLLDEGMDTGPIICQREFPLSGRETAEDLTANLFQLGTRLLLECLLPWVNRQLTARPQDESKATVTRKLERSDGAADWRQSATALERRNRAYHPWPGLFATWEGKVLKLLDVVQIFQSVDPPTQPGQVVRLGTQDAPLGVGTKEGVLGLRAVQLEGRRAQSAGDFLRGYPSFIGAQL